MRAKLLEDLINAMKNKDKDTLTVLRSIKGAMQLEEINLHHEVNDEEFIGIISKQIKTRKESLAEFEKANREDLIDQTKKEIEVLNKYLPEQLSDEEIINIINQAFDQVKPSSQSDMGKIMGLVSPKLKGRADMSQVSKIIKEKLSNL